MIVGVLTGLTVVVVVQLLGLALSGQTPEIATVTTIAAAVAAAATLLWARADIDRRDGAPAAAPADGATEAMNRWIVRTRAQIEWSSMTRADWDRRLRPALARQFELVTGARRARDAAAFDATGLLVLGELWQWVDPGNVARSGGQEPGPGRQALSDILDRLEGV